MLIFGNFGQKVNFERSRFQQVGAVLSEFYFFMFPSLRVLGESCFKAAKAPLHEWFYHWNIHFCYFCTKNGLWAVTVSGYGRCTFAVLMTLFSLLQVLGEKILFDEIFGKIWNIICFEYFEYLDYYELNTELEAICPMFFFAVNNFLNLPMFFNVAKNSLSSKFSSFWQ